MRNFDLDLNRVAPEIEIFILCREFRAQISHSCAQERRFQQSVRGQPGKTDFFNTIGRECADIDDRHFRP